MCDLLWMSEAGMHRGALEGFAGRQQRGTGRLSVPPRLHVPGRSYHVILRGNYREALFGVEADRLQLNDIVADVLDQQWARLHAFCWMTNQLHALLR